jgi:hypothetical protein
MAVDDQAAEKKKEEEKVKQHYEVGEFVAAVYKGQWLLTRTRLARPTLTLTI